MDIRKYVKNVERLRGNKTERTIAEAVDYERRFKGEIARMVSAYNQFLEETLRIMIDSLGCSPTDIEIMHYQPIGEDFIGIKEISVHNVPLMRVKTEKIENSNEFIFIREPIEEDVENSLDS